MKGWNANLGLWKPVIKEDSPPLYGWGDADDGYAAFTSLTTIAMLQHFQIHLARCVVLMEACEESGSADLPFYLQQLKTRIGNPNFVICLDSGCGNYEQLWCTTSLRVVICGELEIEALKPGFIPEQEAT